MNSLPLDDLDRHDAMISAVPIFHVALCGVIDEFDFENGCCDQSVSARPLATRSIGAMASASRRHVRRESSGPVPISCASSCRVVHTDEDDGDTLLEGCSQVNG